MDIYRADDRDDPFVPAAELHVFRQSLYAEQAYETIKQAAESDSYGSEEFARELDDVCRSYNMTVCVMDVNSNMKYVSINGGERLENRTAYQN